MAQWSGNYLLSMLPAEEREFVAPHLNAFEMSRGDTLVEAGNPLEQVYFPDEGMISLIVHTKSGGSVESVVIGREGLLGTTAAGSNPPSHTEALVQMAGTAQRMSVRTFKEVHAQSPALRSLVTRYAEFTAVQAQQSAACNMLHDVPARLARWLLKSRDLASDDTLPLTQEFLSLMLGVRRPSVTTAAQTLEAAGLISYTRGHIKVLNLDGLRDSACECHQVIKNQYNMLFPGMARDHLRSVKPGPAARDDGSAR